MTSGHTISCVIGALNCANVIKLKTIFHLLPKRIGVNRCWFSVSFSVNESDKRLHLNMQSGLTIESYPTMEESLSEQVLFYYFTEKNNPTEDIQFRSFPNIYTAISIFKDCEVKINGNDICITESKGTGYIALTITPDIKPYLISIKGKASNPIPARIRQPKCTSLGE